MKLGKIVQLPDLIQELEGKDVAIYATSGGFDPLHIGHLRCLQATHYLSMDTVRSGGKSGVVVVFVNGDGFLYRKKGYAFMPLQERMEIISGLSCVDYIVPWDDGTQTVIGAIEQLKPSYFCKGGDRDDPKVIPEWEVCQRVGTQVLFGVGGTKVQSSSKLVEKAEMKKISENIVQDKD
jgi:bifunctional ADP-heptose synthase (sugar kinase/adenylyltransferase)